MRVCVMPCAGGVVGTGRMLPDAFGMHLCKGRCLCSRGGMAAAADKGHRSGTTPPTGVVCGVCGCSGVVPKCDAVSARCEVTPHGVLFVCGCQSAVCRLLALSCCVKRLDQNPLGCALLAVRCSTCPGSGSAANARDGFSQQCKCEWNAHAAGVVVDIRRAQNMMGPPALCCST